MFARIIAALARAAAMLGRGFTFLWDAIEEAAEPITSRLPWVRDRLQDAGNAAVIGGGYALQGAGMALQAPGAILREIGSVVGSVLPSPAATPQGVADGAVAADNSNIEPPAAEGPLFGVLVRGAAIALRDGDRAAFQRSVPQISEPVRDWLLAMRREDLMTVCELPPAVIDRHVTAERDADRSPLIPRLSSASERRDEYDAEAIAMMLTKARRNLAGSRAEAIALESRETVRRALPVFDAGPDDFDTAPRRRSGYAH